MECRVKKLMSKKYQITISDAEGNDLEAWAKAEGTKPSSLAAFAVQLAINQARKEGRIPQLKVTEERKMAMCCEFLNDLANGNEPDIGHLASLAHLLRLETEQLIKIRDKVLTNGSDSLEGVGNGQR